MGKAGDTVEGGDVGIDAVMGAAEDTAGGGDVGIDAVMGAAEDTAGGGDVGIDVVVGTAEDTVTGKATRAVEAIEGRARPGRAGAVGGVFTLRVTILGSAGITVGLLAIVVAVSKEEKL